MQLRKLTILCLTGFLSILPGFVSALSFVYTNSQVSVGNLHITPAAGGTIMFSSDPQYLDVKVWGMAQNSLGEYKYDANWQNAFVDLSATTDIPLPPVTWANGHGQANGSTTTVAADSAVNIPPNQIGWANSEGRGSLGQWFQIIGGSGTTDTTVSLDYSGHLSGSAGDNSFFRTEMSARLELWDAMGSPDPLINMLGYQALAGGPNETSNPNPWNIPITTLSQTVTLSYDTWYWIYLEADSETRGQTPEPTPLLLMLPGLALLARRHLRASR